MGKTTTTVDLDKQQQVSDFLVRLEQQTLGVTQSSFSRPASRAGSPTASPVKPPQGAAAVQGEANDSQNATRDSGHLPPQPGCFGY